MGAAPSPLHQPLTSRLLPSLPPCPPPPLQLVAQLSASAAPSASALGLSLDPASLTVVQLQEELTKRGLDTKWFPLQGKKLLSDRLQVGTGEATT